MAIDINIPSQVRTFANLAAFPASGALKTIYIAEDTNKTYRWTGSVYVEISASAAGATWGAITGTLSTQTDLQNALNAKQATLVSGTNIKTINGSSVLGSGDLAIASGVTSVTATAPIASSGGATPDISIATANTSTTGALSSTDWNTFNDKRAGMHYPLPLAVGELASASLGGSPVIASNTLAINSIVAVPFIPSYDLTCSSLNINVTTVSPSGNARILIYSDLNGKPDGKIYESANLDCSTLGIKTALVSFNFTAGVTYYICTHFSSATGATTGIASPATLNIGISSTYTNANSYRVIATFGSAPNPITTATFFGGNLPLVTISVA